MDINIKVAQAFVAGRVAHNVVLVTGPDGEAGHGEIGSFVDDPVDPASDRAIRLFAAGRDVAIIPMPLAVPDCADMPRGPLGYLVKGLLTRDNNKFDLRIDRIRALVAISDYVYRPTRQATYPLTDAAVTGWLAQRIPAAMALIRKRGCVKELIVSRFDYEAWPSGPCGFIRGPDVRPFLHMRYRIQFCGLSSRDPAVVKLHHIFDIAVDTEDAVYIYDVGPGDPPSPFLSVISS